MLVRREKMLQTVNVLKVREKLGAILDSVADQKKRYLIQRMNKDLAILIPVDLYEEKVVEDNACLKRQEASQKIDEWREKFGWKLAGWDSTTAIRKMRDKRTKELLGRIA